MTCLKDRNSNARNRANVSMECRLQNVSVRVLFLLQSSPASSWLHFNNPSLSRPSTYPLLVISPQQINRLESLLSKNKPSILLKASLPLFPLSWLSIFSLLVISHHYSTPPFRVTITILEEHECGVRCMTGMHDRAVKVSESLNLRLSFFSVNEWDDNSVPWEFMMYHP